MADVLAQEIEALMMWDNVHRWAKQQKGYVGYARHNLLNPFAGYLDDRRGRAVHHVDMSHISLRGKSLARIMQTPQWVQNSLSLLSQVDEDEINAEQFLAILEQCKP